MRRSLHRRNRSHPEEWLARIGLHAGPVNGSMVGVQKYVHDIDFVLSDLGENDIKGFGTQRIYSLDREDR